MLHAVIGKKGKLVVVEIGNVAAPHRSCSGSGSANENQEASESHKFKLQELC